MGLPGVVSYTGGGTLPGPTSPERIREYKSLSYFSTSGSGTADLLNYEMIAAPGAGKAIHVWAWAIGYGTNNGGVAKSFPYSFHDSNGVRIHNQVLSTVVGRAGTMDIQTLDMPFRLDANLALQMTAESDHSQSKYQINIYYTVDNV